MEGKIGIMGFVDDATRQRLLQTAWILSLATIGYNIIEGIVSIRFGAADDALALLGFGLDSFVEVISGLGIAHMVARMRRADVCSRDRFERRALRITAASFFLLAAGLPVGAVLNLIGGRKPDTAWPGVIIAAVSIAAMSLLVRLKTDVGKKLGSAAILADAECTRTCFYLSIILLSSSLLYQWLGVGFLDGAGSVGIAWFAWREGRESWEKAKSDGLSCSCRSEQ